jgi:hypothetical protein
MSINFQEIKINNIEFQDNKPKYKSANLVFKTPTLTLYQKPIFLKGTYTFDFVLTESLYKFINFYIELENKIKHHINNNNLLWFSNIKKMNDKTTILRTKVKRNLVFTQNNKKIKSYQKDEQLSLTIEISKIWNFQGKTGVSIYIREIF